MIILYKIAALIIVCAGLMTPAFAEVTQGEVKRIRIAAIFALTGMASEQNSTSLRGVRLAVASVNESGGILGMPIELLVFDNSSTPIGSKIAASKAVKDNVAGIVGPDFSSHAIAVARIAQENRIPMVCNAALNSEVTKTGNYIFRACFTDRFAGDVLARLVYQDIKAVKAVVMTDIISDDSMGLSEHFANRFKALGGTVTHLQYKHRDEHLEDIIQKAAAVMPEVVFLPGGAESGKIIQQSSAMGFNPVFVGGDGWDDSFFLNNGGMFLKQGYYCTHWSKEPSAGELLKFLRHLPPQIVVAKFVLGFDAAMLLIKAIERAGSTEPEKVVKALSQTQNFPGISGKITMGPTRDPIKPAFIRKIIDGKDHYLKTVQYPMER